MADDNIHRYDCAVCGKSIAVEKVTCGECCAAVPSVGAVEEEPLVLDGPIHNAFGLSYAAYLVIPRTVLQSMPIEWQARFCAAMDETHQRFPGWEPEDGQWFVYLKDRAGRFMRDDLADYERGARRLAPGPVRNG